MTENQDLNIRHARDHRRDMQENMITGGEAHYKPLYALQSKSQDEATSSILRMLLDGKVQNFRIFKSYIFLRWIEPYLKN